MAARVRDRLAAVAAQSRAVLALFAFLFVVGFACWRGREVLAPLNFFTQDMQLAGPLDPFTVGGILHAMVGTRIELTIALLITGCGGHRHGVGTLPCRGDWAAWVFDVPVLVTFGLIVVDEIAAMLPNIL